MDGSSGVTCTVLHSLCTFGVTFWMDRTSGIQISLDDLRSSLRISCVSFPHDIFQVLVVFMSRCGSRSVCNNYLLAHFCASLVGHTCDRCSVFPDQPDSYPRHLLLDQHPPVILQKPHANNLSGPRWQGSFAMLSPLLTQ